MNMMEFELDTSGSVMEQIQRLVAPPLSDEGQRIQKRRARQMRRNKFNHGRVVNHDFCDFCKEGGDLICCDNCAAAFHLQCHDPPLCEDSVPPGEWLCHRCTVSPIVEPEDDAVSTSSAGSRNSSSDKHGFMFCDQPVHISAEDLEDEALQKNPLKLLTKAARLVNPSQFELPKELVCPYYLPGSSKRKLSSRENRNSCKKQAHELENGMVPLPAKLCFICSRSCRVGPLVACDYCSCYYHLECLDPPLTCLPVTRWMCPNHVENILDGKLVKNIRLSERVRLWNKYTGPINQHSVKIDFLKKVHRLNPPFSQKIKHCRMNTLKVPAAIKELYDNPSHLMPTISDTEQVASTQELSRNACYRASHQEQEEWLASVVSLQTSIARHMVMNRSAEPSPISPNSNLSCDNSTNVNLDTVVTRCDSFSVNHNHSVVSHSSSLPYCNKPTASVPPTFKSETSYPTTFNHDFDKIDEKSVTKSDFDSLCSEKMEMSEINDIEPSHFKSVDEVSSLLDCDKIDDSESISDSQKTIDYTSLSNTERDSKTILNNDDDKKETIPSNNSINSSCFSTSSYLNSCTENQGTISNCTFDSTTVITSISKLLTSHSSSNGSVNKNHFSNISQNDNISSIIGAAPVFSNLNEALRSSMDGIEEADVAKIDDKLVQILAWQRIQQLLPSQTNDRMPPSDNTFESPDFQLEEEIAARALLCPLSGKGDPVPMPYRKLNIGTGANMDVFLMTFGECSYVSSKHACIFYDEATRHYELLNYSEHGTVVDNVLYSCDLIDKPNLKADVSNAATSVRKLLGKNKLKSRKEPDEMNIVEKPFMSCTALPSVPFGYDTLKKCSCQASNSDLIGFNVGWEGSAILHHGSYVKVGCLQFVFSIVEQAAKSFKSEHSLSSRSAHNFSIS